MVLAVLVKFPFADRRWALPVLVDLYRTPEVSRPTTSGTGRRANSRDAYSPRCSSAFPAAPSCSPGILGTGHTMSPGSDTGTAAGSNWSASAARTSTCSPRPQRTPVTVARGSRAAGGQAPAGSGDRHPHAADGVVVQGWNAADRCDHQGRALVQGRAWASPNPPGVRPGHDWDASRRVPVHHRHRPDGRRRGRSLLRLVVGRNHLSRMPPVRLVGDRAGRS